MPAAAPLPLSRERILRCALMVADRDGLDSASLRRVAGELGVHVTSIYNHVPTKEALLDGIVEELIATGDLPVGTVPWERWVREFTAGVSRLAREHPGAFPVLMRRPVQGAEALATFEAGLAAFHRAGMDPAASYGAVKTVSLAILGCCFEEASLAAGQEELRTDIAALSWQDFPEIHQITEVVDDFDAVSLLTEVLVAGFAAQLPRATRRR